jgi:hypothetical protein
MVTPSTCPQCGNALPPGEGACPICGHQLQVGPSQSPPPQDPPSPAAPGAPPPPPAAEAPRPAGGPATAQATAAVSDVIDQTLERWNVARSGILIAAFVLALLAFLVATFANISYLSAGDIDSNQKFDAQIWFNLALGAAIAAAALLILVRWQSGRPGAASMDSPDFRVGMAMAGLVALFCLAGLFKGFDDSFDAQDSWFNYARVFAFLTIGWLVISRPIPQAVAGMSSVTIGLLIVAVGAGALVLGQFMGLSDDFSTFVTGVSFQSLGVVAMFLALGWFLGLERRSDA